MTVCVGVVGWPVTHSRSPAIFQHWFDRHGIAARYELIPVAPDDAPAFFAALPQRYAGVNVTLPHKQTAAGHVRLVEAGARLGVVNTLWREAGAVCGTSSDGEGFLASLDQSAPEWRDGRAALVIGAGGAAVAIVDALVTAGHAVQVANRTPQKAADLATRCGARALPFEAAAAALGEADLLINTTSLGMVGSPPLPLDLAPMPEHGVVADIVYNPLNTPLLRAAQARGLATVDGLGMLLHQATVGFERWFGVRPAVDAALREAVSATL